MNEAEKKNLSSSELVDWEERAAIREYDGGQPREVAEEEAMKDLETWFEELRT